MSSFLPRLKIIGPYKKQETFQLPATQSYVGGEGGLLGGGAVSFYKRWERLQRMGDRLGRVDLRELMDNDRERSIQAAQQDEGSLMGSGGPYGNVLVTQAERNEEAAFIAEEEAAQRAAYEAEIAKYKNKDQYFQVRNPF